MATATRKKAAAKAAPKKVKVPAGAKQPSDRKAPQEPDDGFLHVEMRGKTWHVSKDALDDFELLDDINALEQQNDASRMPSVLRRLIGDEGYGKAMDLLRDPESQRVSVSAGSKFVWDLLKELDPNS